MSGDTYVGKELDLFARATNWKRYWASEIRPYVGGDVLEVGAGIGVNTGFLRSSRSRSWTCLEPDPELANRMKNSFATNPTLADCQVRVSTISKLGIDEGFDTILYVDVLEHIERDDQELEEAARSLRVNGRIIVLSPAHQFLYSPFDKAIGHFRRYDKHSLSSLSPAGCALVRLMYLDSVGLLASISNRLLLRQAMPTIKQIMFWDRLLVPPSCYLDRLTFHKIGKTIVAVWEKNNGQE
jgi:SAM-dependent methyltransferase